MPRLTCERAAGRPGQQSVRERETFVGKTGFAVPLSLGERGVGTPDTGKCAPGVLVVKRDKR